jgi:hypothetical protein
MEMKRWRLAMMAGHAMAIAVIVVWGIQIQNYAFIISSKF